MTTNTDLLVYPISQGQRSGSKVSWLVFAKQSDADLATTAAKHNAHVMERQGFDFGFCTPGEQRILPDGRVEVCIP